jgi:hypothetical protein
MTDFKETVLFIENGDLSVNQLLSILILTKSKLDMDTVSEMARKEGKTPSGIRLSKRYKKLTIGKQMFAVKGLAYDGMPF